MGVGPEIDLSTQLVGIEEIAQRLRVTKSAVTNWAARPAALLMPEFPDPLAWLACGRIYYWPEVEIWAHITGRLPAQREALIRRITK